MVSLYPQDQWYTFSIELRGCRTEDTHSLHFGLAYKGTVTLIREDSMLKVSQENRALKQPEDTHLKMALYDWVWWWGLNHFISEACQVPHIPYSCRKLADCWFWLTLNKVLKLSQMKNGSRSTIQIFSLEKHFKWLFLKYLSMLTFHNEDKQGTGCHNLLLTDYQEHKDSHQQPVTC